MAPDPKAGASCEVARPERVSSERTHESLPMDRIIALAWAGVGVGHDLRTPLGALRSNATMALRALEQLRASTPDGSKAAGLIETLIEMERTTLHAVARMLEIVASLNPYASQPEAGSSCEVGEVVERALRLCRHVLDGVSVCCSIEAGLPRVAVPEGEMLQVVTNLVLNAAQAVDPGGRVEIAAAKTDDTVALTVTDDGPGLSPELAASLFTPGVTTRGASGGSGLGLSVVKRIVETRDGRIDIANDAARGVRCRAVFRAVERASP